jgi:hypothetical protein
MSEFESIPPSTRLFDALTEHMAVQAEERDFDPQNLVLGLYFLAANTLRERAELVGFFSGLNDSAMERAPTAAEATAIEGYLKAKPVYDELFGDVVATDALQ